MIRRKLFYGAALIFLAVTRQTAWAQPGRGAPLPQGQNRNGMHVYLWGGLKSHGEGQHDYPQFLADWSKILTAHGAVVDGALHSPSSADLEHTDVVVIYKGDAAYLNDSQKAVLDDVRQTRRRPGQFSRLVVRSGSGLFCDARGRRQEARRSELHPGRARSPTPWWTNRTPS